MKIIQEDNFADIMKDEVEPYLYALQGMLYYRSKRA